MVNRRTIFLGVFGGTAKGSGFVLWCLRSPFFLLLFAESTAEIADISKTEGLA